MLDPISARYRPEQGVDIFVIPTGGPRRLRAVVEGSWQGRCLPLAPILARRKHFCHADPATWERICFSQ